MKKLVIIVICATIVFTLLVSCSIPEPLYETFEGIVSGTKESGRQRGYTIIYIDGRNIRVEDVNLTLAVGREYKITTKDSSPNDSLRSRYISKIEIID